MINIKVGKKYLNHQGDVMEVIRCLNSPVGEVFIGVGKLSGSDYDIYGIYNEDGLSIDENHMPDCSFLDLVEELDV